MADRRRLDPELRKLLARVQAARNFPHNTCPASRHLHIIAERLAKGKPYPMLEDEPEHCAETMLSVLASLWELRAEAPSPQTTKSAPTPDPKAERRGCPVNVSRQPPSPLADSSQRAVRGGGGERASRR